MKVRGFEISDQDSENLPADQDLKAAVPEEEAAAPAAAVPVAVR